MIHIPVADQGNCTGVATTADWLKPPDTLTAYDLQSLTSESGSPTSIVFTESGLEMSSARRSLRDKARGELSGFEREYPW
jgi:hypothetical protein